MITYNKYGVSFSVKQCRNFGIDWHDCLSWALKNGWRRFRLMSYWNEIEKKQGTYDFTNLDAQIALIKNHDGIISLCLGVKQPRWPEYHWPNWTKDLGISQKNEALLQFVEKVVNHYKNEKNIISWQLENEALLSNFGANIHIDRTRLKNEFNLVKCLDPTRLIIMSASNGWGIPVRNPIPDMVGFSLYGIMHSKGQYRTTIHKPWLFKLRKYLIDQTLGRPSFIHELQLEPWGPKPIWKMTIQEQDESMNVEQIAKNIQRAQKINAYPIDVWGLEWWYWREKTGSDPIWDLVKHQLAK